MPKKPKEVALEYISVLEDKSKKNPSKDENFKKEVIMKFPKLAHEILLEAADAHESKKDLREKFGKKKMIMKGDQKEYVDALMDELQD